MVQCEGGYGFVYDKLIYALGGRCFLPPMPGNDLPHVVTIRTIEEARRVSEIAKNTREAVVIAAALLAWKQPGRCAGRSHVTVLEQGDQIRSRQIDQDCRGHPGRGHGQVRCDPAEEAQTDTISPTV